MTVTPVILAGGRDGRLRPLSRADEPGQSFPRNMPGAGDTVPLARDGGRA